MGQGVALVKYHRDIGFPDDVFIPYGKHSLRWTPHARAAKSRYEESGKFIGKELFLPKCVDVTTESVFEIAVTEDWRRAVTRVGVRTAYDRYHDVAMAVSTLHRGDFQLVTAWICRRTDSYRNLDTSNYCVPGQEEEYIEEQRKKRRDSRAGVCNEGASARVGSGGASDD